MSMIKSFKGFGSLWAVGACIGILCAALGTPAIAEIGVVSGCPLHANTTAIGVSHQIEPYTQPISLDIQVNGAAPDLAQLSAKSSPGAIDLTLSVQTYWGSLEMAGTCGSIVINPLFPGTYEVRLFVAREGSAPLLVAQRSIHLGYAEYPYSVPFLRPFELSTGDFAPTQPVGEMTVQPSVSLDGAAQVSIPIFAPPGRQGVQPSLSLTYSSRGGDGPLGVGWSLSGLSTVTACRRAPALDEAYGGTYPDRLCLDGARLVEVSRSNRPASWQAGSSYNAGDVVEWSGDAYRATEYATSGMAPSSGAPWTKLGPATATVEYRTETDSYRKVVGHWQSATVSSWSPEWLEVFSPDGTITRYGSGVWGLVGWCQWGEPVPPAPRKEIERKDVHGGCHRWYERRAWVLVQVEDRFGNQMEIDYEPAEPLLPHKISYTNHAIARSTKAIHFEYETRSDVRLRSFDGVSYLASKRLKTILVTGPLGFSNALSQSGVLRRYDLSYEMHPTTAQSQLTQVKECAGGGVSAPCLSPLVFAYSGTADLLYADKSLPISPISGGSFTPGFDGFRTADVNGDGFDDILYREPTPSEGWSYRLSDGVAVGSEKNTGIFPLPDNADLGVSLVNLDRNQTVDALVPLGGAAYAIAADSQGSLTQLSVLPTSVLQSATTPWDIDHSKSRIAALGDFNGDGLPDLVVRHACHNIGLGVNSGAAGSFYLGCRWGLALNSTSNAIGFDDAMDFRWSGVACTISVGAFATGYDNCAEASQDDPAFILDVDHNGVNELIAPVRSGPNEEFFRKPDRSMELQAFGFENGTASVHHGTGLSSMQMTRLFLDVNGDGLPDAAEIDTSKGQLSVAMNVGGTFEQAKLVPLSVAAAAAISLPNELRVGDLNDDGLEDLYLVSSRIILQADGQLGFLEKAPMIRQGPVGSLAVIPAGDDSCAQGVCQDYARRKWDQLLDFNGDGLTDILQMRGGTAHLLQRIGPAPGLLEKITGGQLMPEVRFSYRPSPGFQIPGDCGYPQYCLRKGMWLVSEVGTKANVPEQQYPEGFNRTSYTYSGGRFDIRGRGWLGFAERIATDRQTGSTTKITMDNRTAQARSDNFAIYRYPGAFRPVQEIVTIDSRTDPSQTGKIYHQTTDYLYRDCFVGAVATSALVETRQTTEEASAQGQTIGPYVALTSRRATFDVNSFGLVTRETSQVFDGGFIANIAAPQIWTVPCPPPASPATVPPGAKVFRREITRTPSAVDQLNWLVQRYDRVTVTSTEPARAQVPASATEPARPAVPEQTTTRVIDVHWKPGTATIDRVTTAPDHAADPSLYSVTEFDHDPTGNVKAIRVTADSGAGATTRLTKLTWDSVDQTLIQRRENPLQHAESFVYYAGLGELYSAEDANGVIVKTRRDRFGRPREIDPASSESIGISYELAPGGQLLTTSTGESGHAGRLYQDKWGQPVREEQSQLHGKMAIIGRTFDRLGRLKSETMPFYEDEAPESAELNYDNLGRLVEGSIGRKDPAPVLGQPLTSRDVSRDVEKWVYGGLVTEHTNARGVRSTTTLDGAGRPVRSATIDPTTGREVVTRLEYGPFDVLDAITDSAGHRTALGYDTLGRRISTADPTLGATITGYNGYGEVISFRDGAGSTTKFVRDDLGRTKQSAIEGTTRTTTFTWDTAAHGKGLLAEATSDDDVKTTFTYDELERPTKQEWEVPMASGPPLVLAVESVWDGLGRPELLKYPALGNKQLSLRYVYDPQGALYKITDDATGRAYWTLREQDASGLALSEQFGDTTTTDRFFDARKRLKLIETTQRSAGKSIVLQKIAYDYGPGELIRSRHNVSDDPALRTTEDFEYDFLGRLKRWTTCQNCRNSIQQYSIDDLGNITSLDVLEGLGRTATLKYGPSATSPNVGPLALREISEGGTTVEFRYDTAGRQKSGDGRTTTWSELDLPRQISIGGDDVKFLYDAGGNRVVKAAPSNTTVYAGDLYELRTSPGEASHAFNMIGPNGVFGQVSWTSSGGGAPTEETWYFHPDALGSPDVASRDGVSGVVARSRYDPFGQRRYISAVTYPVALPSDTAVGFTGHEADDQVGLINMRGRIYDPRTMRFLTGDPVIASLLSSQALNPYSYVRNDPINLTDPSGLWCAGNADACIDMGYSGGFDGGGGSPPIGPFSCCSSPYDFSPNDYCGNPGVCSGASAQPTKEDATRRGADAGTGWGEVSLLPKDELQLDRWVQAQNWNPFWAIDPDGEKNRLIDLRLSVDKWDKEFQSKYVYYKSMFPSYATEISDLAMDPDPAAAIARASLPPRPVDLAETFDVLESVAGLLAAGESVPVGRAIARDASILTNVNPMTLRRTHTIEGRASTRLVRQLANDMSINGYDMTQPIDVIMHEGQSYIINGHHRRLAAIQANENVSVRVLGPEIFPMTGGFSSVEDVVNSSSLLGPDRLRPR